MAGYSKGIVDTRKLNDNNKARLGRRGDTKIREVGGRDSHVNALEAYLIDVNGKAGEDYTKAVGAGTINPLTGMPEYHPALQSYSAADNNWHWDAHDDSQHTHENQPGTDAIKAGASFDWGPELSTDTAPNDYSYEGLSDVTGGQLKAFDPELGEDDVKYFKDIFTDVPFGFLEEQQTLATKGLESAYGDTIGALGSQQATLGRTTGLGFTQATKGAEEMTRKANMAFSGTVTQGLEAQKKQLLQDYTAGMGDIKRERGSALDTLTLGKEGADLDYRTDVYGEQQRQMDEYWAMIGMRQQVE